MEGAEPTFLPGQSAGVLLLHDLAGTPQIFRSLTESLGNADMAVDVPLLPGHGTSIDELNETTWDDWAAAAQLALDELASRSGSVVVAGISMGAALACLVASNHPSVAGVIAINPRVMPVTREALSTLQSMIESGITQVEPLAPDISDRAIEVLRYSAVPTSTLLSMFTALNQMDDHWSSFDLPMLVITSAHDHRVSPDNADWLSEKVSGHVDRLTLERSFHEATLDVEHEKLEREVVEFVRGVTATLPE